MLFSWARHFTLTFCLNPLKPNISILIRNTLLHCHPIVLYIDWSKHRVLGNPNWQEADQLAIYTALLRSWTWGDQEQTSKWQGGGLELRTTRLQVQHPKHHVASSWEKRGSCSYAVSLIKGLHLTYQELLEALKHNIFLKTISKLVMTTSVNNKQCSNTAQLELFQM